MSKIIHQVAEINTMCFMSDDPYSTYTTLKIYLKQEGVGLLTMRDEDGVYGYIIYTEFKTHIESNRRAVVREYRGKGRGIELAKRLIKLAKQKGKDIYTYVSKTNLPSLNSNLKVGYRIEEIGKDWVYIRYKV